MIIKKSYSNRRSNLSLTLRSPQSQTHSLRPSNLRLRSLISDTHIAAVSSLQSSDGLQSSYGLQ
ncbi:hypothetical protein HanXRQr2_Chr08g0350321 [Helianthus annuus]|uniref:Uncharacterized protein n=1 Tax=Helianthus annuus TaxID=4232 RepID=A0A9K3NEF4_HELAN|nr:hypothetical protein HanXRQr2_Chr08g0350321 [Helianthus annuus]